MAVVGGHLDIVDLILETSYSRYGWHKIIENMDPKQNHVENLIFLAKEYERWNIISLLFREWNYCAIWRELKRELLEGGEKIGGDKKALARLKKLL